MNEGRRISPNEADYIPFVRLSVRYRKKIVADHLEQENIDIDVSNTHQFALKPEEWHERLENANKDNVCIVDCRNYYESDIGRFESSKRMEIERFHESFDEIDRILKTEDQNKELYLYCTGGVRCEKISAYVSQHTGFKKVNTLQGGINNYHKYIAKSGKQSLFKGKNYQFDNRNIFGNKDQSVTDDILTHCEKCGTSSDVLRNCQNPVCNVLMVVCDDCHGKHQHTCSKECEDIVNLPPQEYENYVKQNYKAPPYRSLAFRKLNSQQKRSYSSYRKLGYDKITPRPMREYVEDLSSKPSVSIDKIFEGQKALPTFEMSVGTYIGSFLGKMTKVTKAKRVLEIGTHFGYSALCIAENLPADGELVTLEINESNGQMAKINFNKHPDGQKIKLMLGPALETLEDLKTEKFDMIFIDADKSNYINYYTTIIDHEILSKDGVMFLDNVLFRGEVIKEDSKGNIGISLDKLNNVISKDTRVSQTILPIRDGLSMVTWN